MLKTQHRSVITPIFSIFIRKYKSEDQARHLTLSSLVVSKHASVTLGTAEAAAAWNWIAKHSWHFHWLGRWSIAQAEACQSARCVLSYVCVWRGKPHRARRFCTNTAFALTTARSSQTEPVGSTKLCNIAIDLTFKALYLIFLQIFKTSFEFKVKQ